jgi:DNA-binding transcriptional MerR regulator
MAARRTIGAVARQTGVPVPTIRFYEAAGVIPTPARTAAGYRVYSVTDVRRLRLVRRARLLGLGLPEVKALVAQAFAAECTAYVTQLLDYVARQRCDIRRHMQELQAQAAELDALEAHVRHAQPALVPGQRVADCSFCPLIDDTEEFHHDD